MNEPIGRFGFFTPRRERRIARLIASSARSWPMTRFFRESSMWSSFSASSIWSDVTGMPVQLEMISSTSARVTSTGNPSSRAEVFVCSISSLISISRSRRKTARSKSFSEIAFFISLTICLISLSRRLRFWVSAVLRSFTFAPASSRMSMALSGKKRSGM